MTTSHLLVLLLGAGAIGLVNWYFFVAGRGAAAIARAGARGVQEATITVLGGYSARGRTDQEGNAIASGARGIRSTQE